MINNMSPILKKVGLGVGVILLAGVLGRFSIMLLTPSFGTVVAYANQQPPLKIVQVEGGLPSEEIEKITRLAKLHFQNMRDLDQLYWPEPSLIEEHTDCWLVSFTRKIPVYRFLGFEETVQPTDRAMFMSITKSNYVTRLGRWCTGNEAKYY